MYPIEAALSCILYFLGWIQPTLEINFQLCMDNLKLRTGHERIIFILDVLQDPLADLFRGFHGQPVGNHCSIPLRTGQPHFVLAKKRSGEQKEGVSTPLL